MTTSTEQPEGKSQDPPPAVKELFSSREREKNLRRRVEEAIANPLERGLANDMIMDLGVLYLRERRWEDADAFFKQLDRPDRKALGYHVLSHLGQAIVLAFRDQPAESNREFVNTLDTIDRAIKAPIPGKVFDPKKDRTVAWRNHVAWRELIAQALERNYANAPKEFPVDPRLEALRQPPRPTLKGPPMP